MNSSVHVGLKARVSHRLGVLCIWCWPPQYIARCIHRRRGRWIVETARGSLTRQSRCVQGTSLLSLVDPPLPDFLFVCLRLSPSLPPIIQRITWARRNEKRYCALLTASYVCACLCVSVAVFSVLLVLCNYAGITALACHSGQRSKEHVLTSIIFTQFAQSDM